MKAEKHTWTDGQLARPIPAPQSYAGWGSRVVGHAIDILILLSLQALTLWALPSRGLTIGLLALVAVVGALYKVVMHAWWGQTIGKALMGIRVVMASGRPITWRSALLRSSVDIVFAALATAASLTAALGLPAATWHYRWRQLVELLSAAQPSWAGWFQLAGGVWFLTELVVSLSNPRRRAVHDFIAGTVVVQKAMKSPSFATRCVPE